MKTIKIIFVNCLILWLLVEEDNKDKEKERDKDKDKDGDYNSYADEVRVLRSITKFLFQQLHSCENDLRHRRVYCTSVKIVLMCAFSVLCQVTDMGTSKKIWLK